MCSFFCNFFNCVVATNSSMPSSRLVYEFVCDNSTIEYGIVFSLSISPGFKKPPVPRRTRAYLYLSVAFNVSSLPWCFSWRARRSLALCEGENAFLLSIALPNVGAGASGDAITIVNGGNGGGRGRRPSGVRVSLAKRCEEAVREANRVDEVFQRAKVVVVRGFLMNMVDSSQALRSVT